MVAFPETEPMTIKRIEVALRNKDMYLLQEAANKLHEKYHMGFSFTMFDELSQIKEYIENNEIPTEIKDILCPVIDGILSSAGKEVSEYKIDEEKEREKEEIKRNYDYNFGNPANDYSVNNEYQEAQNERDDSSSYESNENYEEQNNQPVEENQENFENYDNQNYGENSSNDNHEGDQQSFDFTVPETPQDNDQEQYNNEQPDDHYVKYYGDQPNYEQNSNVYQTEVREPEVQNEYQEENHEDNNEEYQNNQVNEVRQEEYNEEHQEVSKETYQKEHQEDSVSQEQESANPENIAIFYHASSAKDESYGVKDYRQKLNFINSGLYSKQPINLLEKISSIMDMVDVKDSICDFLLGISKAKCKKTFVTTSLNQNITNYLANNNVKFQIPMVQNTYSEDSSLDIIPMFGATNLFVCKKCGSMFLNTGSYLKVLSLGCPECDSVAYPSVYDVNDVECNSIFWHRAYSAMAESKIWVIINPPKIDENECIMDFLKVTFKSSMPKAIYIYSKDKTYENMVNQFNKETKISSFDSLEALYNELMNNKGIE